MQKSVWSYIRKLTASHCGTDEKDVFEASPQHNQKACHGTSMEPLKPSNHAVTVMELPQGNSTRRIVEMIFRSSWFKTPRIERVGVERVLKINNNGDMLNRFEEYREMVKRKSGKRCSRCMADGNEMLRFHGTTISCSLNISSGVTKPCSFASCNVCNILRSGFSTKAKVGFSGIYTTASSRMAHDSVNMGSEKMNGGSLTLVRRGMLVCRVIAGHVHEALSGLGFDSVEGERSGRNSKPEDLEVFVSDPRGFLPCFLVIYSMVK